MVKICSLTYPKESEPQYKEYYDKFSYELHDFQKWAIEALVNGHHVLITAPTGTGKSMPAEFALDFFHSKNKKTIYCSPIKSLSNQKYYDFTKKYPHISVGIITGDIKANPDADVLIMTTEILLNKLYQLKSKSVHKTSGTVTTAATTTAATTTSFDMDIKNELGCVIFDEFHMIGDRDRGHVWENSVIMLPTHIQIIGLSATLDNPEKFATWIETRGVTSIVPDKLVYFAKKLIRPVPLTHYNFITVNSGIFKAIKDKSVHSEIRSVIDKPHIIQDENGVFNDATHNSISKTIKLFKAHDIRVSRPHILNQVTKYLVEKEMLPALCYVFSIKQLEKYAQELTTPLLEFDSKIPYTIDYECEQIIRRLPNYKEYLHLPEYVSLVTLLRKGIATHHSKMMPILREIVEILFARGSIKVLFCTTSVAIGLNLPVKTCLFTDIYKHDGEHLTVLQGHEYVQAAGRSGRLGLDTVGHVIHLNNLFGNIDTVSYKTMLKGVPQKLVSKFKISYNLILNLIDIGDTDFTSFAKKSMIQDEIESDIKNYNKDLVKVQDELEKSNMVMASCKAPTNIIVEYMDLKNKQITSFNKKRREIERAMESIVEKYYNIEKDVEIYKRHTTKCNEKDSIYNKIVKTEKAIDNSVNCVLDLLEKWNVITKTKNVTPTTSQNIYQFISCALKSDSVTDTDANANIYELTLNGHVAKQLREIHCIVFSELIVKNRFKPMTTVELIGVFSCFTNVSVSVEQRSAFPVSKNVDVKNCISEICEMYNVYREIEIKNNIDTGIDYSIQFDLTDYMMEWCDCQNEPECKGLLQKIFEEKGVFLGEFIKAVLKINNISAELEKVAETMCDVEFLDKLKRIPELTMKFVATNQSLYV